MKEEFKKKTEEIVTETAAEGMDMVKNEIALPIMKIVANRIKDYVLDKINNIGQTDRKSLKTKKDRVIITSRGVLKTSKKWWLEDD